MKNDEKLTKFERTYRSLLPGGDFMSDEKQKINDLIDAIKELQAEVEALKKIIRTLQRITGSV